MQKPKVITNYVYRDLVNSQICQVQVTNFISSNICVNVIIAFLPGEKNGNIGDEKWILVMMMFVSRGDCLLGGVLLELVSTGKDLKD